MSAPYPTAQRRVPTRNVNPRARRTQSIDNINISLATGLEEGCGTILVRQIHINTRHQEQLPHDRNVSVGHSARECGVAPCIGTVDWCRPAVIAISCRCPPPTRARRPHGSTAVGSTAVGVGSESSALYPHPLPVRFLHRAHQWRVQCSRVHQSALSRVVHTCPQPPFPQRAHHHCCCLRP
jgi:hypothetical protein